MARCSLDASPSSLPNDASEREQDGLRRTQVNPRVQRHVLDHQRAGRVRVRRLVALSRPRQPGSVVRMLDHHPARGRAPTPEGVQVALRVGRGGLREVQVDVHRGAGAGAACEPRVEVDEDGANELAVLERGVPGDIGVADRELDDLRCLGAADERVDRETGIIAGLDMRRRGGG